VTHCYPTHAPGVIRRRSSGAARQRLGITDRCNSERRSQLIDIALRINGILDSVTSELPPL